MKYFLFLTLNLSFSLAIAQTEVDSARYDEVRSLVSFYKYMLNTVGAEKTTVRDKEVIISESFKKAFENPEVQIEDDLVLERKVITNKDVAAYLRDVDFFFKHVQFDFQNLKVEKIASDSIDFFYLVSFESTISGITLDEENYLNSKKRFIEINLNEETNDLKIASVYSTKLNREAELQLWWESLSFGWASIFKGYVPFDSISNEVLLKIASLDSLNLSGNQFITGIEALSALKQLKVLDISHTKLDDISPLRYARSLRKLNAQNTKIVNISPLQYFKELTFLNASHTEINDISVLGRLKKLSHLDLSGTGVNDFSSLKQLTELRYINLSNTVFEDPTLLSENVSLRTVDVSRTQVDHLFVFQSLPDIGQLDLSESKIVNLRGLENHPKLEALFINQTAVEKLDPLRELPVLKKVYADLSGISQLDASNFMANNPEVVVVTNSQQITEWWISLPANWKAVLSERMGVTNPAKEDLAKLLNIDSLDVSNRKLYTSGPLKKFKRLKYLDVSYNDFTDFEFTTDMTDLEQFKAIDLPITSAQGLEKNVNLKSLMLSQTNLSDIQSLYQLHKLDLIDAEGTQLDEVEVIKYLDVNPQAVVIFQTEQLKKWWNELSSDWKNALNLPKPDAYALHGLVQQKEIAVSNQHITSLIPLAAFIDLQAVTIDRVRVLNLNELYGHQNIRKLTYTNGPLQTLEGITQLSSLEFLNISNTAIEDLKDLYYLRTLKHLNCSGTGIKNLKGLDELVHMESLDVSNTRIWRLERLYAMSKLKTFICNNTRLSQAKVDAFQELLSECKITFY